MGEITVVARGDLEETAATPGIVRERVFETENNVLVRATVSGGTTTGWHHHAERDTFGYVVAGRTVAEYGPDGRETADLRTGDFYHVPPGVRHRGRNPADEDAVIVESFVGTGPLVVNVDGPG